MADDRDLAPILGKAYGIFVMELDGHLDRARTTLDKSEPLTEDEFRRVSASFHTIKGGAGFFGLRDIASIAGTLEHMLLKSSKEILTEFDTVKDLLEELEECARNLPKPGEK